MTFQVQLDLPFVLLLFLFSRTKLQFALITAQGRVRFQIPCWNKNPKTEINLLCSLSADYSTPFTWAIRSVNGLGALTLRFRPRIVFTISKVRETGTAFSEVPLLPEVFHCNDPKSRVSSFTSQPEVHHHQNALPVGTTNVRRWITFVPRPAKPGLY